MRILLTTMAVVAFAALSLGLSINHINLSKIQLDEAFPAVLKNVNFPPIRHHGARITGGFEAEPNSFPYQIGLSLKKSHGLTTWCGGSLIARNIILTAAHCLDNTNFGFAYFGAHNIRKDCLKIKIEKNNFIIHPDFNATNLNNDIALIKLTEYVELNDKVQIIELPTRNHISIDGTNAIASGWGRYSDDNKYTSNVLRFVEVAILNQDECVESYTENVVRNENVCIDGRHGQSTCSGDSGGPLGAIDNSGYTVQIGLSSFGSRLGCEKGYPAVFTRITSYLDWISKNSGIQIMD